MTILGPIASVRNANPAPSTNPRDSWPDWTDEYRWEPAPNPDDYRPTPEPEFIPTPEEEREAVELLNNTADRFGTPAPDWDALAEAAKADDVVSSGRAWL